MGAGHFIWLPLLTGADKRHVCCARGIRYSDPRTARCRHPAETDPYSAFDWLIEDFSVMASVPWPTGSLLFDFKAPDFPRQFFRGLSILQTLRLLGLRHPGAGTLLTTGLPGGAAHSLR